MRVRSQLLTTTELRGVGEGAIRLNNLQMAENVVKLLLSQDCGPLTRSLQVVVKAGLIQQRFDNRHFWSVTATVYDELMQLAEDTAELLAFEPLPDTRLPLLAASLLLYLHFVSKNLVTECWKKIGLIERVHKNCAAILRFRHDDDSTGLSELSKKLFRAEKDETFRQNCLDNIFSQPSVTSENCAFLARYANPDSLNSWLINGGTVNEEEGELSRELFTIYLQCCSKNTNKKHHDVRGLKSDCQTILSRHNDELLNLNPEFILEFASELIAIQLPNEACNFLKPLLPTGDYWVSPLLRCYLNALLASEKYSTLEEVLHEIPKRFWNRAIWQIKARLELLAGNYNDAKNALESGKAFGATSQIIVGLIDVLKKMGKDSEIPEVLIDFSEKILSQEDGYSLRIIVEMFLNGLHDTAERILLGWFVADPQASAKTVTDVFNALILRDEHLDFSGSAVNTKMVGVKYYDGKTSLTKLIVPPGKERGQHLLSSTSPLGKHFLEIAPGVSFKEGVITYKLEERLPALVAAYHISLYIRDSMNQGDDPFHMFNVPEDPHEFINQLCEIMASDKEHQSQVLEQKLLPIMFKGHHLKPTDPFSAALGMLSECNAPKNPLPNFDSGDLPDIVILDVYALAYIAITGLASGLLTLGIRLCVTSETEKCIRQWQNEREREDGGMMTTLPDGKPLLLTTEDIFRRTEHIAKQILMIFEKIDVLHPQVVDLSPELIELRDGLDISVFSSLRLAISCNIPWLCIDLYMAQAIDSIGCPVVKNCLFMLTKASGLTPICDRKHGLFRHVIEQLPFPITMRDIFELSRDDDSKSIEVLAKLIRQYPNAFQNTEHAAEGMSLMLVRIISSVWGRFDGLKTVNDVRFPLHVKMLANACFYVVSYKYSEKSAEYRIALLIHLMVKNIVTTMSFPFFSQQLVSLICELASGFLQGHLMKIDRVNQQLTALQKISTGIEQGNLSEIE